MITVDAYRPELWHDFFVMVGGGAAALAGLVFVAMSINLDVIAKDATHRYRAMGTLSGFTAAFATCALVLMGGQNYQAAGIEWLTISVIAAVVHINGYRRAMDIGRSSVGLGLYRLVFGTALYIAEIIGAALLALGYFVGLYVAAVSLIGLLGFMITGAWLLLIGVHTETREHRHRV
jgi:hypothetical protein